MKLLRKYRKIIVFLLDISIIVTVCIGLFLLLPEYKAIGILSYKMLLPHLILLNFCGIASQVFFRTYNSLWRYAQCEEYVVLLTAGFIGYAIFYSIDYLIFESMISKMYFLAAYSISLLGMLLMRLLYRLYRMKKKGKQTYDKISIAIIGAGEAGVKLLEEVVSNPNSNFEIQCFIDDSIEKIGKRIHNVEVIGPIENLDKLLMNRPVKEIIVAIPSIASERRKAILDICTTMKCRVRVLPDTLAFLQKEEKEKLWDTVRDIRIEELLGREQVTLNEEIIEKLLCDKVVMVTGGGGSIGSELCRQIARAKPKRLVIVDIYENNAYDIQQELLHGYGDDLELCVEIASVRDKDKIYQLFERHHPNLIFHAAAHKHVPLMEDCPEEAILNNIMGTYHVVQAAHRYEAEKFVLISTDKAVNPTSIMGASKRFCEMILQSMKGCSKTKFVSVRFGNVLGSNGSVIPLFQKQIAQGGPVTITDKRIVRFFMTISEAAQLVLQAGAMANSAEVYVLDMGEPVKIIDLAENLIRLSGHIPYTDIPIIETGLRPGEKLYEELLMSSEELIATENHKIFIERQKNISQLELKKQLKVLTKSLKTRSKDEMKKAMKQVVTTYRDPEEVNTRKEEAHS